MNIWLADRVLTLNMNILLALFLSTWSRARGPDSGPDSATCEQRCAGLAHGRDYSDCRASEEMSQKCLAHAPMNYRKNLGKKANGEGFSTLTPQTAQLVNCSKNGQNLSRRGPKKLIHCSQWSFKTRKYQIKKWNVPTHKKSFWSIVAWSSCCIENFKTNIFVYLSTEMDKLLTLSIVFQFLESGRLQCFTKFYLPVLCLLHY